MFASVYAALSYIIEFWVIFGVVFNFLKIGVVASEVPLLFLLLYNVSIKTDLNGIATANYFKN